MKKYKVLSANSLPYGLKLPGFIALYLGLEHIAAPGWAYGVLGCLFAVNVLLFALTQYYSETITIEELIKQKQ